MLLLVGVVGASVWWYAHPRVETVTKTIQPPVTADEVDGIRTLVSDLVADGGLNQMTIAAIAGNVYGESLGDTTVLEQNGSDTPDNLDDADAVREWAKQHNAGIGLLQWTGDRTESLLEYAAQQGEPWYDAKVQSEYLLKELRTSSYWTTSSDGFWNPTGVREATTIMEEGFVRPADPEASIERRTEAALQVYSALQLGTIGSADDASSTAN